MKKIIIGIVALIVIWVISLMIQYAKRGPVAEKLIQEKLAELKSMEFEKLTALVGKGYIQENKKINGVAYYMGYVITKPGDIKGAHTEDSIKDASTVKPEEKIDAVQVTIYADCINIVPFFYIKFGPSFGAIILHNRYY